MSKILDNRPAHVHINTIINIENWQLTCPYAPERTAYSVKLKVLIQNIIKNNLDISQIVDINKSRFSQSGKIIVLVWNICKSSANITFRRRLSAAFCQAHFMSQEHCSLYNIH